MTKYALFLGCTTPTRVLQYELSARWVCKRLGIELVDNDDFVCCGSVLTNLSIEAGLFLAAMNLAHAEAKGLDILTLCGSCAGTLAGAAERLRDEETRAGINERLRSVGLQYRNGTRVRHISRALYEDVGTERIRAQRRRELSGLRVAPHYGCHYLKPKSALEGIDEPDNPRTLHELIEATGAATVGYERWNLCCGGYTIANSRDIAMALIETKLDDLKNREADCLVTQCQTCFTMYSLQQRALNRSAGKQYDLPVLLYPQLLGLALGADPVADLGLDLNGRGRIFHCS